MLAESVAHSSAEIVEKVAEGTELKKVNLRQSSDITDSFYSKKH